MSQQARKPETHDEIVRRLKEFCDNDYVAPIRRRLVVLPTTARLVRI